MRRFKVDDLKIGSDLKTIRKIWRISQVQMAAVIGIHQTALCRVEMGRQALSAKQFLLIRAWLKKEGLWGVTDVLIRTIAKYDQPNVFLDEV